VTKTKRPGRRIATSSGLACAALALSGAAPPPPNTLQYDLRKLVYSAQVTAGTKAPVEPGEQYPADDRDRAIPSPSPIEPEQPQAAPERTNWYLNADVSAVADSNVNNATNAREVPIDFGGVVLPVPLDPTLRQQSGAGFAASASGGVRHQVSPQTELAAGVEASAIDYEGGRNDDSSLLGAAGFNFKSAGGTSGWLQGIVFDRWYGGTSVSQGFGLRGNVRQPVGPGRAITLYADARHFESGFGDDFGGTQASVYLTYEAVLDPNTSSSFGGYVRREWLGGDPYSSREAGLYGGLNRFLSPWLTGGISGGVSRVGYDAPILFLSPEARDDWRFYASTFLTTRRPLFLGIYPSLTYTYNRTRSSVDYYDSDRHRLRLGLSRAF